jgi:hypothetical protein
MSAWLDEASRLNAFWYFYRNDQQDATVWDNLLLYLLLSWLSAMIPADNDTLE